MHQQPLRPRRRTCGLLAGIAILLSSLAAGPEVTVRRVPNGGVQPQLAVAADGALHLIYLAGDSNHSDIFYATSVDGGATWSPPIRVNAQPGSALAVGTVRGAHLALGLDGRAHVAWMGSKAAEPRAPGGATPMLYTRLADDGKSFEPQRNVIQSAVGLDGGGSIAADGRGQVFVGWHAPAPGQKGEQARRVWVARSTDDGKTFAAELPFSDPATGACGCCGMRLLFDDHQLFALYRGAARQVNRGMYLIEGTDALTDSSDREIAPMQFGACLMSTSAMARSPRGLLAAWETRGQVYWSLVDPRHPDALVARPLPGASEARKHPAICIDSAGRVLVAWTEGTGWNKGGTLKWQVFDAAGQPLAGAGGTAEALPANDAPAAISRSQGGFLILY